MGDSYTVQISTKLINQLAREDEKRSIKKKVRKTKPKPPKTPNQSPKPEPTQTQTQTHTQPPLPAPIFPSLFLPVPAPPPVPVPPEVDTIREVLKDSEKVLEKLRVEEGEKLKELNKRSKELREKEFKLPYQNPVPCLKERSDCLECYKNYANEPLKCAETVKRFADCTRKSRQSNK